MPLSQNQMGAINANILSPAALSWLNPQDDTDTLLRVLRG